MNRCQTIAMKIKTYIFAALLLALCIGAQVRADTETAREYQVKAAFLYNFIMFIDWPQAKMPEDNSPVIIGIIGKDPFKDAFDPVKDKLAKGKKVIVKRFSGLEELKKDPAEMNRQIDAVRNCHLLFICSSEKKSAKEIIDLIKGNNILTVGDMDKFLESEGGMINFVLEDKKVRFEVNLDAAKQADLKIRSQLLRLAVKVIE